MTSPDPVLRTAIKQWLSDLPASERDQLIGELSASGPDGTAAAAAAGASGDQERGDRQDRRDTADIAKGSVADGSALYDRIGPKRISHNRIEHETIGAHEYDFR